VSCRNETLLRSYPLSVHKLLALLSWRILLRGGHHRRGWLPHSPLYPCWEESRQEMLAKVTWGAQPGNLSGAGTSTRITGLVSLARLLRSVGSRRCTIQAHLAVDTWEARFLIEKNRISPLNIGLDQFGRRLACEGSGLPRVSSPVYTPYLLLGELPTRRTTNPFWREPILSPDRELPRRFRMGPVTYPMT
jgi:hypothetical protein